MLEKQEVVDDFSEWLQKEAPWNTRSEPPGAKGVGSLRDLTRAHDGWGGWKDPEGRLYGAALNHADVGAVADRFGEMNWIHPQVAQLMIRDQEQDYFRMWMIVRGELTNFSPVPPAGVDDMQIDDVRRGWRESKHMWTLDPGNSPLLMEQLRPHRRGTSGDAAWVGEGWRSLVERCHLAVLDRFPDYELLNIKQKYGILAFQAFPRPTVPDEQTFSAADVRALDEIIQRFVSLSEQTCEFCGRRAHFREERSLELTLCDTCHERFSDPPQPCVE